jgi:hypothetical protein
MKFLLGSIAVLALQWALVSRASIGPAAADLPLAFVLYAGLRGLPAAFPFGAWSLGLAVDILGTYPAGLHALAFLLAGLAARAAGATADPGSVPVRLGALLCGSLALKTTQALALAADGAALPLGSWIRYVAFSTALTAVAGLALFLVLDLGFGTPGRKGGAMKAEGGTRDAERGSAGSDGLLGRGWGRP